MSAATKTAYQPRILTPRLLKPVAGVTVRLVESHTPNEFYFVWQTPDGGYRCQCKAASFGAECCHKKAFKAHMIAQYNIQQRTELDTIYAQMKQADPEGEAAYRREMATFACSRSKANALPADKTAPERSTSLVAGTPSYMWKSEDGDGNYIPRDYYQHAYR